MDVAVVCPAGYNVGRMPKTKTKTAAVSFRLTKDAAELLAACAVGRGVSQVTVIEESIRDFARKHRIKPPAAKPTEPAPKEEG